MADFLLELRSEEIPARMQERASKYLEMDVNKLMSEAGIKMPHYDKIQSFVTPRRLTIIVPDLPLETAAVAEEIKGPKTSAPAQALEGFLRKTGLTQDQLIDRDGVWFAVLEKPGRKTIDVLADAIPKLIFNTYWPKSMRWGAASASTESLRWVRPLQGIVALLGDDVVPCEVDGIISGSATMGHRFHHHGPITIGNASDYASKLRACHVIVDQAERQQIIREGAAKVAAAAGLTLVPDEALVAENAGLTEWPVPLLGRFDAAFLAVPPEVIRLTAKLNQKYFMCTDRAGKLANAFVCTANISASDGGAAIIAGNERVLTARLSDAKFFYEQDLKTPLAEHAKKLDRIVFHEKLGTVADKVERVAKLARWLCAEGIVKGDPDLAEQAARLCKADLVTGMVGEFPELQGVMGGYYARAQGLPDAVADAIRDHYKPVGQGDEVPTAPATVAVSLADKLDTLVGFFAINERPTGSKDPFALRRAALGIIRIIVVNSVSLRLIALINAAGSLGPAWLNYRQDEEGAGRIASEVGSFLIDRLKIQQKEAGVRHDLIDAAFSVGQFGGVGNFVGDDNIPRLLARVTALQSFVGTEDGTNLLAAYKRATNILSKEGTYFSALWDKSSSQTESALFASLANSEPQVTTALAAENFTQAMSVLATLRAPIDHFFTAVMVNDPDADVRAFRLGLLARFRDAVHKVADFSKIEG